jgi:hypothetical protein
MQQVLPQNVVEEFRNNTNQHSAPLSTITPNWDFTSNTKIKVSNCFYF